MRIHMRLAGSVLRRLSPLLRRQSFRLQSQMDIHPQSLWHNPEFVRETGGFFPPSGPCGRRVDWRADGDSVRRDMLVLLLRDIEIRAIPGSMAELGVYKGETAALLHHFMPDRRLHLFDTFSGFDPQDASSEATITGAPVADGQFGDTSVDAVKGRIRPGNSNVAFHPGRFPASCDASVKRETFAFVHLDADLYQPTLAGLEVFYPLVNPGGYIVVHDYNAWQGARRATDEFLAVRPEIAIPMPDKSGSAVIAKIG